MALRVLVVEDEPVILDPLNATLSHAGYTVALAASGEPALDHLSHSSVSLVMLDIAIPQMSGLDGSACIRRRRDALPVVMVSARTDTETVREVIARGCCGFVVKPFTPTDLVRRLARALMAR